MVSKDGTSDWLLRFIGCFEKHLACTNEAIPLDSGAELCRAFDHLNNEGADVSTITVSMP